MSAPEFWSDQQQAAKVSAEHARASRRLDTYRGLESDVAALCELAS